ncbi:hypothetical protein Dsin_002111 [Dipteronia sinensis]|uniref:Ubiquitin-like protease family profile domain-containing protein n=1 Tax=Dipteronia sinensis TaxID=43782 RepID=A0AAE0EKY3_9ROSI|nr:hypothetical protein Dsin_002111 [Dipteronia sinensis]
MEHFVFLVTQLCCYYCSHRSLASETRRSTASTVEKQQDGSAEPRPHDKDDFALMKDNRMGEDVDFLVKVAEHFPAKINSTSSIVAIKQIKEKLTEAQLALFRTTCFGKLLEMHELKFSGQLVHHLLLRQIRSSNKSEMWFAVGGKTFRFSIQEFCLITGLACGPDPPDCKANNEENTRKLDALGKRMDQMDKKLDLIINLLGGEGKAPTGYQYNSKEKLYDAMEVDGEKMDAKVGVDLEEDVPDAVVIKGEDKIVHKHVEAQVNVDVWKGEEIGVREHYEAQVHVDDRSDDEANIPAEKVEDKCNTNLEDTSPMVDMHNKGVSPSNNTDRSIIVYEKPPPNVPKRRPKKAAALKSPYTDTQVIKPKKLTKFKPFPNLPQSVLKKFESWLEEDDFEDESKNIVHLPLCPANRAWFKTLYTPDKWLTDEHIDSALYWIRKVKFESSTAQMENCTTTDVLFQVYLPLNYESKHWVLAEIDFIARKITVYDSETYCIGPRKFERFMEPLSTLLPLLLQKIGFFSKRPEIEHGEDMTPWSVERRELVPQQEKSDCGVFVIKFVEHLIHGESIDSVKADKVKYFRTYLCLNLWRSKIALW